MSKQLIDNISRSNKLCDELAMLEKQKRKLQTQLEELQEKCEHRIIIVAKANFGYSVKAKCLFCNKYYTIPHELREIPSCIILEAWKYTKLKDFYSEEEIYNIISSKAKKFLEEDTIITSEQLAQKLETFFNN